MKYLILCLLLTSCATPGKVWIVKQTAEGGVLGYQMHSDSDDEIHKKLSALVQCPGNNKILSDELKSEQFVYTEMVQESMPAGAMGGMTRKAYASRQAASVPTVQTGWKYWRELTYRCN